jgi:hypothetical protein
MTLRQVFSTPTVTELAAEVARQGGTGAGSR